MESGVSMNYEFTKFGILDCFLGLQDIGREIKCTLVFTPFKQQSDPSPQWPTGCSGSQHSCLWESEQVNALDNKH